MDKEQKRLWGRTKILIHYTIIFLDIVIKFICYGTKMNGVNWIKKFQKTHIIIQYLVWGDFLKEKLQNWLVCWWIKLSIVQSCSLKYQPTTQPTNEKKWHLISFGSDQIIPLNKTQTWNEKETEIKLFSIVFGLKKIVTDVCNLPRYKRIPELAILFSFVAIYSNFF